MNEKEKRNTIRRMEVAFPYLLQHNKEHVSAIEKWSEKAGELGLESIKQDMDRIVGLFQEANEQFEHSIQELNCYK